MPIINPLAPAEFSPTWKGFSGQGAFRYWAQTVLPAVYDDSLSYQELLAKVVQILNVAIEDMANAGDDVTGLKDAYEQLESYVNAYFSEMDVQQEINNKLDTLVEDGTLTATMEPYLSEYAQQVTALTAAVNETRTTLESDYTVTNERISNIIAHNNDSDGNTELIDIRTDWKGVVHSSAGDSVRAQFPITTSQIQDGAVTDAKLAPGEMKTVVDEIEYDLYSFGATNGMPITEFKNGNWRSSQHDISSNSKRLVPVKEWIFAKAGTFVLMTPGSCQIGAHYLYGDLSTQTYHQTINFQTSDINIYFENDGYFCVSVAKIDNTEEISPNDFDGTLTIYHTDYLNDEFSSSAEFAYGGMNAKASTVDVVQNTIRLRTPKIKVKPGFYNIEINHNISDVSTMRLYKYLSGELVQYVNSITNPYNLLVDSTFDSIAIVIGRSNDAEFTESMRLGANVKVSSHKPFGLERIKSLCVMKSYGFENRIYAALGDSITYGYIPRNYDGHPGQLKSYAALVAERLGMKFLNYGVSGSTVAYHASRHPMSVRYADMANQADLISVMGGTNDVRNGIQLGTMNDRDNTTFYGAWHVLLSGLYKKYIIDPGTTIGRQKKIVVLTPIKLLESSGGVDGGTGILKDWDEWINAIIEVADYYSMPVLDFYNNSGINPHLNQTVHGTVQGYTDWYNPYITDGTHPTQEGAEMMADLFEGFLKNLF